jgi:hypothetical protein
MWFMNLKKLSVIFSEIFQLQTNGYQNSWTEVLWTGEEAFYPYIVSL